MGKLPMSNSAVTTEGNTEHHTPYNPWRFFVILLITENITTVLVEV